MCGYLISSCSHLVKEGGNFDKWAIYFGKWCSRRGKQSRDRPLLTFLGEGENCKKESALILILSFGRGGQSRGSRVRNHSHCFEEEISHVSSISVHLRRDHLVWDFRILAWGWSFGESFTLWIIKLIIIPHRHVCKGHAINFICTHGLIILLLCWPQGSSHVSNQLVVYLGPVRLLLCWPQGLSHVSNQLVVYLWLYLDTF